MGVEDALSILEKIDIQVLELRFSGNGVVGGIIPMDGVTAKDQANWAELAFQRRFNRRPVVSALVVRASTSSTEIERLQSVMTAAPPAVTTTAPAVVSRRFSVERARDTVQPLDGSIDEHYPSIWEGDTYRTVYPPVQAELRAYDYWFVYESAYSAQPSTFPSDWGMELGITTWNDDLPGWVVRPFCPPGFGDSDWDFWSGTYEMGGIWGANVPESSAPYADYNIASDGCDENGVEIGIGFPRQLAQDTLYLAFAELYPGNESSSRMAASVSMKSNDCNNLGLSPHTDCMGLNTDRDPPAGFDGSALLVNSSRNWTSPACFLMGEGFTNPIRYAPGVSGCPTVVYY
ncbi:hypothetical protein O7621_20520 [Solwaraspora sp. WMMD937]|uniref:hypothetical protein n=1 Tax=Solwaraspora sp. WMMD937 TaxID=3016090 RepID=UPI00249A94C3|nr:hypothetical protein [Solwaraspora sp. WMMD937]WFE20265.1 hypothetical protein O7621_20520 [Solwaraspora sp. WMMD937]